MDKVPKSGYVFNPKTGRQIKIGGPLYRELVAKKIIKVEEVKIDAVAVIPKPAKIAKDGFVINPKTGREIKKGAALYKQLLKEGVVFYDDDIPAVPHVAVGLVKSKSPPKVVKVEKKCPDGQILNPATGRCVSTTGKIGLEILKKQKKELKEEKKKFDKTKCINKETFLLFTGIEEVPDEDFIMLPSGYCFAVSEIIDWIKSSDFNNRNPHVSTESLFDEGNKKVWDKYPELSELLSKYFKKKKEERENNSHIIKNYLDVLYKIGDTGRICYYDNLTSLEMKDSSQFEYSINALAELSEMIEALPSDVKKIFKGLRSASEFNTIEKTIKDANEGTQCIHGIGKSLIAIFVSNFLILENYMKKGSNPDFKYEPLRAKMYFVVDKHNSIVIYNAENRLVFNTTKGADFYYKQHFEPILKAINPNESSMIWDMKTLRTKGLSKVFMDTCKNEDAYQVTVEAHDEWHSLEEWRKFKLQDGYCFDLLYLITVITGHLNITRSTNPAPVYPYNIFTNVQLTMIDLINLRRRITNNYIIVAPCLFKFLYNPQIFWSEDVAYIKSPEWMEKVITSFSHDMRFKRYLEKKDADGTPLINGYWVNKTIGPDLDERKIYDYLQTMNLTLIASMKPHQIPTKYYYNPGTDIEALIHGYNDKAEL